MRYIKNPNDIVDEYVSDHLETLGENLHSIIMYGSAVTHEFMPGQSDVNMMIVLKKNTLDTISSLASVQKKWTMKGVAVPVYLAEEIINFSSSLYPLEFLDMKENYRVLHGNDLLKPLEIEKSDILRQLIKELNDFSLQLRRTYLDVYENNNKLFELAKQSVKSLLPLLKGVIFLYGDSIPNSKSEIVGKVEDLMNLGASSLSEVFNIANSSKKIDIKELFKNYCGDIDRIISIITKSVNEFTQMDVSEPIVVSDEAS